MIFSPEQFIIDLEIIRRCQRLRQGISTSPEEWLEDTITNVGPGGNFLGQRSTRAALRTGELYLSKLGCHEPYERWEDLGKPDILEEARDQYYRIIDNHQLLPFDDDVENELRKLQKTASYTRWQATK
jgi:trimethylamine--corrinoid protein Co-methyltransferase